MHQKRNIKWNLHAEDEFHRRLDEKVGVVEGDTCHDVCLVTTVGIPLRLVDSENDS